MKVTKHTRTTIAMAVAIACTAMASAQAEEQKVQRVEVTGSHIKRTDYETASPLQVLSRSDLENAGVVSVRQALDLLTNNPSNPMSDLAGANAWASGSTSIALRNLGVTGTLVLLNGRRLPSYGFADGLQSNFVNIDAMPMSIVDRIEVLKDGASAVYGSDAIAGVINVITRQDFQGVTVGASTQQSLKNHILDREHQAFLTLGRGDYETDGFNFVGHVELYRRDGYTDRAIRPLLPSWYVDMNPDRDAKSSGSFPGNYTGSYPRNYPDPALAGKRISVAAPGCAPENLSGALCMYDYWQDSDAQSPATRATFLGRGRLRLSGTTEAYVELSAASTENAYHTAVRRSSAGLTSTWYNWNKHALQSFTDPLLPVGHPYNPYSFPIGLNYRFTDYPDMFKNVGASSQYHALAGVKGQDFGWDWDAAVGSMGSSASQKQHLYPDRYGYYDAIVSGEYKFGQQNPRELLDRMFPEFGSHGHYRQQFVDFTASREIGKLEGGPLQIAVGGNFRHESFLHESSQNIQDARIVGFSAVTISGARNLAAAYAELNAPFTKQIEANFALRADRAIGQTGAVVPKIGMKYKLNDDIAFRGTVSQGFRAPSIPETGNGGASWFNNGIADPRRCDAAVQMQQVLKTLGTTPEDANDASTAYRLGCQTSFPSAVRPNPELKPEKTNSYTFGLILQPVRQLSLTVDYYNIKRRDEISVIDINSTLANEMRNPSLVMRDPLTPEDQRIMARVKELGGKDIVFPVGPVSQVDMQYINLGKTRVSGIDLALKSAWSLGEYGKLRLDLDLTKQLDYRTWDFYKNDYTENRVGRWGYPRMTLKFKPSWEQAAWSAGASVNYTSETALSWGDDDVIGSIEGCAKRGISEAACHIASFVGVDLWAKWKYAPQSSLKINLYNALDRGSTPILVPGQTARSAVYGRILQVGVEHHF